LISGLLQGGQIPGHPVTCDVAAGQAPVHIIDEPALHASRADMHAGCEVACDIQLRVNREKSVAAYVEERKFLGYRLLRGGRLGIAPKSLERAKDKIRKTTRRNRGDVKVREMIKELNRFLSGWIKYFRFAEGKGDLESPGAWMRRKLRCVILKRLKRTKTVTDFLIKLGVAQLQARVLSLSGKRWWRKAGSPPAQHAMNKEWFAKQKLFDPVQWYETFKNDRNRRGTEQVCPVV
jgi:RNA-directed DNA polymerase